MTTEELAALREAVQQSLPLSDARADLRISVHRVGDSTTTTVAESNVPAASAQALARRLSRILPPLARDTAQPGDSAQSTEDEEDESDRGPHHHFRLLISAVGLDVIELAVQEPATCRPTLINRDEVAEIITRAAGSVPNRGSVLMRMFLEGNGEVSRVEVTRTSGDEVIDALGMTVGYAARFTPASVDGYPVRVWVQFPVTVQ